MNDFTTYQLELKLNVVCRYRTQLYIYMSYKKQELFTFASTWLYSRVLVDNICSFLCCLVVFFVFVLCLFCPMLPVSIDCLFVIPVRCSLIFNFLVVLFSSFLYSRDKCKRCHIWVNYFKDTTFFSTTHCQKDNKYIVEN